MHCKELTTAILSLLPSLFPLALPPPSIARCDFLSLLSCIPSSLSLSRSPPPLPPSAFLTSLSRRPLPFLYLSLSYSSHRFFIVYYCLSPSPLSLYLYLSSAVFPCSPISSFLHRPLTCGGRVGARSLQVASLVNNHLDLSESSIRSRDLST